MARSVRAARLTAGAAMIAAPAALLAAAVLHPPHPGTDADAWFRAALEGRQRFYVAHLLFLISAVLLVPAVLGVARILVDRGRGALGVAGGLVALAGTIGFGGLSGLDLVVWWLSGEADQDRALGVVRGLTESRGVLAPLVVLTAGLAIGVAMLAFGLWRAQAASAWTALLLGGGPVVLLVGLGVGPLVILASAGLLVALVPVGRREIIEARTAISSSSGTARQDVEAASPLRRIRRSR